MATSRKPRNPRQTSKESLNSNVTGRIREHVDTGLTSDQGVGVEDDQNSLTAGERGSTLMEDFLLREKITHFDHERIPERVVHARGAGAHGSFRVYESLQRYTKARFLTDPNEVTPVFVRFSTVAGSRGSADTARDVRGFATKFYTAEGNFDLVGNNIPVFFIQDAIKFPDIIHAVKPEPHNEIPQAQSAHDTFWDFMSLTPEATHMAMWVMSDRAIPRSYSMMEGFGVHTFRLINEAGKSHLVKFHWKPVLGIHSLVWSEAQKLGGIDPDFHRRGMWDSIENGQPFEYELGLQVVEEGTEDRFEFDVLDATKLWPEEVVPVELVGKMTLDRNPENFFAETEQVAFDTGNIVPGIDFTEDPLLQGRLFSYLDTQLIRLGGPNFAQIPINQPLAPIHHNQRDGYMQQYVDRGRTSYSPNSLQGGAPREGRAVQRTFETYPHPVQGTKVRVRSASFADHFSQAELFWKSMSTTEQGHIVDAFSFELGKVATVEVRRRYLDMLTQVNLELASRVAGNLGLPAPSGRNAVRDALRRLEADWDAFGVTGRPGPKLDNGVEASPALSIENSTKGDISGRRVAILATAGADATVIARLQGALRGRGAVGEVVATHVGEIDGGAFLAEESLLTQESVTYDAVFVAPGADSVATLQQQGEAIHFVIEAFKHCKVIGAAGDGSGLLESAGIALDGPGIVTGNGAAASINSFIDAVGQHRFFEREAVAKNAPA